MSCIGSLCRDTAVRRVEAFQRRSQRDGSVRTIPTSLLPHMVSMLSEIEAAAPKRSSPILGLDLKFKKYEQRKYAADYKDIRGGRSGYNTACLTLENTAGDLSHSEGKVLIELVLELLIACCNSKNVVRIHHAAAQRVVSWLT